MLQNRPFCHILGLQLKLFFDIKTKARQNPWRFGLFWEILNPKIVKSSFCHKFFRAKSAYIAIIAISGRFFGRIKVNVRTYGHHTENNRGRLVEPIPNKGALNPVLRTEYQKKSAPFWFKRRENSADL